MNEQDTKELTETLVTRALANDHSQFIFLTSPLDLKAAWRVKKSLKSVTNSFKQMAARIMRDYISSVDTEQENLNLLLSYIQLTRCVEFYVEETKLLTDMISEYLCYILSGHVLDALVLRISRPEADWIDWRTQPTWWRW